MSEIDDDIAGGASSGASSGETSSVSSDAFPGACAGASGGAAASLEAHQQTETDRPSVEVKVATTEKPVELRLRVGEERYVDLGSGNGPDSDNNSHSMTDGARVDSVETIKSRDHSDEEFDMDVSQEAIAYLDFHRQNSGSRLALLKKLPPVRVLTCLSVGLVIATLLLSAIDVQSLQMLGEPGMRILSVLQFLMGFLVICWLIYPLFWSVSVFKTLKVASQLMPGAGFRPLQTAISILVWFPLLVLCVYFYFVMENSVGLSNVIVTYGLAIFTGIGAFLAFTRAFTWPAALLAANSKAKELLGVEGSKKSTYLSKLAFNFQVHAPLLLICVLLLLYNVEMFYLVLIACLSLPFLAITNRFIKEHVDLVERYNPKIEDKTKESSGELVITYRPIASWERWLQQRMQDRSWKKLVYLLVMLAIVLLTGMPEMILRAMVAGGAAAGVVGAEGTGDMFAIEQTLFTLSIIQWLIGGGMLAAFTAYVLKPTNIALSAAGIKFLWRHGPISIDGKAIPWSSMTNIAVGQSAGNTTSGDQTLDFYCGSSGRALSIKLGSVMSVDDRERILKAIENWGPSVQREPAVLHLLEPPADHSYTELWLQALAAPPKRERFKPLVDGVILRGGQFKVAGPLGVGGQGTAYLAKDVLSDQDVVLKEFILPVYVATGVRRQALERFENEARILKQLDHDQIVKLVDFFVEDHRTYLVLEHIDGKSLKELIRENGPMTEAEVISLSMQMCDILDYLHGLAPPVVHRDFTPDNLILRKDGKLKLVDFNVAQQSESTATGTVVGKHAYLPPEQFRGEPCTQSDIYSMGCTLFYLLTGKEPEPITQSHPRHVDDSICEHLDALVAEATAVATELRIADSRVLKERLSALAKNY